MDYEQFVNAMLECVKKNVSDTELVEKQEILKNNGVVAIGLSVRGKSENAAPVIYLEEYFHRYCNGESLELLAEHFLQRSREAPEAPVWDYENILDFQKVRDRIVYKLINAERNEKLLREVPNLPMLDFAIVFYVLLPDSEGGNCSILVRNVHMDYWKLPISTLYQCAKENTPGICPYVFCPLSDFVETYLGERAEECPLYVLSNATGINGAAVILYPEILKEIYKILGDSYYLLPSSIHEFLLLPEDGKVFPEDLKKIVREINRDHLSQEEFLSDNIYYFSGDIITKI